LPPNSLTNPQGAVLLLTSIRSLLWSRLPAPLHLTQHLAYWSGGLALLLLTLLNIGNKAVDLSDIESAGSIYRVPVAPFYRLLSRDLPLVVVAAVYTAVWLVKSGATWVVHRRLRPGAVEAEREGRGERVGARASAGDENVDAEGAERAEDVERAERAERAEGPDVQNKWVEGRTAPQEVEEAGSAARCARCESHNGTTGSASHDSRGESALPTAETDACLDHAARRRRASASGASEDSSDTRPAVSRQRGPHRAT
jgi:hypothetical protein